MPGPREDRGVLAAQILTEARTLFATHGYAGTTLRAVARAAGVDPALVYHYYSSKEGLLDAATTPPPGFFAEIVRAWESPADRRGQELTRRMLSNWQNPEHGPILRAILQIAGNEPSVHAKLSAMIDRFIIGPAIAHLDDDERALRSSLIASQLMGVAFMRFLWRIEPLASMHTDDIVAVIGPTVQLYLDGEITLPA